MAEPKKQVPLRLNAKLYDALAAWAEDDFRSVNRSITSCTACVWEGKRKEEINFDSRPRPPRNWTKKKTETEPTRGGG